jgi:hypothetical protein
LYFGIGFQIRFLVLTDRSIVDDPQLSLKGAGSKAVPSGLVLATIILVSWKWLESTWGRRESSVSLVSAKQSLGRKALQPAWTEAQEATKRSLSTLDRIVGFFTGGAGDGFLTSAAGKPYHLSEPFSSGDAGPRAHEPEGSTSATVYRYGIDVDLDLDGEIDLDDAHDPEEDRQIKQRRTRGEDHFILPRWPKA